MEGGTEKERERKRKEKDKGIFWIKRKIRGEREKTDRENFQITNRFSTLIPNIGGIEVGSNLWERDWSGPITGRTCHGRYK